MATKLVRLKCQNCGSSLDLDMDHLIAYCPHCGQKLLFDVDQIGNIIIEKEKTKQQEIKYKHNIDTKKMKEERDRKYILYSLILIVICLGIIFGTILLSK